jgi:hypothetical protein
MSGSVFFVGNFLENCGGVAVARPSSLRVMLMRCAKWVIRMRLV